MFTLLFNKWIVLFVLLGIGLNSNSIVAQPLKIKPSILVKGTYIDNENRSPAPVSADIIAEVSPSVSIIADGVRTKGSLDYTLRKQVSYTRNINNLNHVLKGAGNLALVKNYVNVFGSGNYGQRTNRIGQNILVDRSSQLTNLSNFGSISAGINLTNYVKRYFDSRLRYTFNTAKSGSNIYTDTSSKSVNASLNSGRIFRRLIWGGNSRYRELNYENRQSLISAEVTGKLGYFVNPRTGFHVSVGYESNPQYLRVRPNSPSKGVIATATGFWRSPKNLGFELTAGKRAYGNTYTVSTDWKSNTTNLNASFGQTIFSETFSISMQQKIRRAIFRLQHNKRLSDYNYISFEQVPSQIITTQQGNPLLTPIALLPSIQVGTYITNRTSTGLNLQGLRNNIDLSADYSTRNYTERGTTSRTYKVKSVWKSKINSLSKTVVTIEAINANDRTLRAKGLYTSVKFSYDYVFKKVFLASLSGQQWTHKPGDGQNISVKLISISIKATY